MRGGLVGGGCRGGVRGVLTIEGVFYCFKRQGSDGMGFPILHSLGGVFVCFCCFAAVSVGGMVLVNGMKGSPSMHCLRGGLQMTGFPLTAARHNCAVSGNARIPSHAS